MPPDPAGPQQSDAYPEFLGSATTRRPLRLWLEPHLQRDARGPRDGGMGVHIVHPLQRFSLETRRIEVVDVRHRGVQEVEHLERDGDAPEKTRLSEPGIRGPAGSSSENRAEVNARSASAVIQDVNRI